MRALEACGIAKLAACSPHRLSYGQQHLVALAAVLAPRPELLLLDDPLAGLDPDAADRIMAALRRTSEEDGTTIFWASHHLAGEAAWSHRILGIDGGRFVQH